ncbi:MULTISPECIES: phosphate acyltransferase [Enorma]|nr:MULTISPECIES: phosphate acyltransferase [Enorma]
MSDIIARAAETPRRIGLSEVESPDVLRLAQRIVETEIGVPVLVGDAAASRAVAAEAGVSTEGFEYVDNADEAVVSAIVERYTAAYDDFSQKACTRRAKDNLLCAMLLLKLGDVDGVASGKECPTGDVVAAAMGIVGLAEGVASPSSLGIAEIPGFEGPQGEFLGLADCAITVQPGVEELAGIAIASADTAATLLGWEPRVALLSFSTMGSAQHESLETVRAAVERVHELRPDLKCDGELQLDAAIMPAVAEHKVKRPSEVAGRANILIFPNLHAGNIGVKLVQIFGHANAYGPVLQGFAKPVCDFSRSAPVDEMLGNVAMLVVRAAAQEAGE